jgi:hypothetical protein
MVGGLPHDVLPRETVVAQLAFRSPSEPGRYEIAIEVVLPNGSTYP